MPLAAALPEGPAVVVLDEFPWLCGSSPDLEGALQVAWDREFERKPVLFILIGSDISVMEAFSTYERPLFGRVRELVVNPFELGDTARMAAAEDPVVAIDAQLLTGGYPRPSLPDIARGRPDLALARVRDSWPEFQGRAIEPIIRASVERLVPDDPDLAGTGVVGGYWTRSTTVEVDLVGVDRWPNARKVTLAGAVKWREQAPFGRRDLTDLIEQRTRVPGAADAALVGVSRSGFAVDGLDRAYTPADLLAAWRATS